MQLRLNKLAKFKNYKYQAILAIVFVVILLVTALLLKVNLTNNNRTRTAKWISSLYKIKESATGKLLMQFRSTTLGVRVEAGNLEPTHIQDINALQRSLKRHEPIPVSFTPVGKQEAEYFARIDKITNALVQYAIAHQKDVEIDGVFSYKWQATTDGNVSIYAKDGRGSVLEKAEGQLKSSMSERDLIYFEQMLPRLQPAYQRQQESTALRTAKVNSNELER
jgi:hypothetical protein